MKKIRFALLSLIFGLAAIASAQNTTVTGTVTDSDSIAWANGVITFSLVGSPGGTYYCSGTKMTSAQTTISANLDASGAFSTSLCSNTNITPVNTQWAIQIASSTSASPQILNATSITGGSQSLTSYITSLIKPIRIAAAYGIRAYADIEITNPTVGAIYYNIPAKTLKAWDGSAWNGVAKQGYTGAAVVIAASNSPLKALASIVCTGTNDQTCINNAIINNCPNSQTGVAGCDIALEDGVYNISGSVIIDNDHVTLRGMHHCMWGGYFHSWYTSPASPVGAIGTGCAQLRATTSGFNLFELQNNNPGGTGSDTYRHRGIELRWLYFVGFNYNNTAIHMPGSDDFIRIYDNVIQRVNTGIDVTLDSPIIADNSIQDIAGNSIVVAGINAQVRGNLIYDNGGYAINVGASDSTVEHNIIGDMNDSGIVVNAANAMIVGNRIGPVLGNYLVWASNVAGGTVSGNTFDQSNQLNITTKDIVGSVTPFSSVSVTGNSFVSSGPIQPGAAINFSKLTGGGSASGNTLNGYWFGGAGSLQLNGAANAANNVPAPTLNPPAVANSVVIAGRWQASQITGITNGSPIVTWPDSSGWNRPLTIASGTGPLFETTSLINSGPGVRFNGTNQALGIPTFTLAANQTPKTAFIVFSLSALASVHGTFAMINPNTALFTNNSAGYIDSATNKICEFVTGVGCSGTVSAGATSTTYVAEWLWNGASSRVAINGASSTINPGIPDWSQGLIIGAQGTFNGQFFPGDIAEIDLYNGAATTGDAATIGAALCTAYGVTCAGSW